MAQSFGEYASPTDTIAAILGTYPFSIGLFRELIQNSDDAKATKQIFVLDSRNHATTSLFHPNLADTQGPALLAYNDALFSQDDWDALQSIHRSSKKTDTSKIGKYGIGFRSCYHVTDNPQILSASSLAILDPQHTFSDSGGAKFDVHSYPNHLATFDFFPSSGSVIRLPLRLTPSSISKQVVTPDEIRTLFSDFIREELAISQLFLKHVRRIEVWEISESGSRTCLTGASLLQESQGTSFIARVDIESQPSRRWRILQSSFPQDDAVPVMSNRLGRDVRSLLEKHKLFPNISIAVPLDRIEENFGRLFTYLPLPIRTGFPCHIHGLFALTQSRQNLSNRAEVGVVKGSDDSVLIEWNQMLFDEYLPRAWATLLSLVIETDQFDAQQVYRLWPGAQALVETGDALYWKDLPEKILSTVVTSDSAVWPTIPHISGWNPSPFGTLSSVYVASMKIPPIAVQCMANAGLLIIQPPEHIQAMLTQDHLLYTPLVPRTAHAALLDKTLALESMNAEGHLALLEYLLSSKDLEHIIGLPLVTLTNRKSITLFRKDGAADHIMLDGDAVEIWGRFDGSAIPLKSFSPLVRELFLEDGPRILNLTMLTPEHVVEYLKATPFGLDFSTCRRMANVDEVIVLWLSRFWVWAGNWTHRDPLLSMVGDFRILPTTTVLLVSPAEGVFSDEGADAQVVNVLQRLAINFLHPNFSLAALDVVKTSPRSILSPSKDVHAILERLQISQEFRLGFRESTALLPFMVQAILDNCRVNGLDEHQQRALRSLPIFPILVASPNLVKPEKSTLRFLPSFQTKAAKTNTIKKISFIPEHNTVFGVTTSTSSLLPLAHDVTFLDGSAVDLALLAHLNPDNNIPLTEVDVVGLALEHFPEQSKYLQTAFMEYMVQHRESLPPRLINILRKVEFIPVLNGTLKSLEHVVDPVSPLTTLYAESGDRVPRTLSRGDENVATMLQQLRILGVLRGTLTPDIVYERIRYISALRDTNATTSKAISIRLIDLLYTSGFDATQLEIPVDAKWVPTNRGMLGHEECLDRGLHRPELFDEVFPLVDDAVNVSHSLRIALGWDKELTLTTLMQQLGLVIAKGQPKEMYKKTRALIKELSLRVLEEEDWATLKNTTEELAWIPISPHHVATTSHAVFYLPLALPGFYEIPPPLAERPEIKAFLTKMGCTERPGTDILIAELKKLQDQPPTKEKLQAALMVLKALPVNLSEEEREAVLVPDMYCNLLPSKEVFYNDIGERAYLEAGDLTLAHPRLDDLIARRLHLSRLGLKFLHLKDPGLDMGEKLTTTIRNVLKQYGEQQTLTEFFANASDAGATKFKILVDDALAPAEQILSPAMAPFQRCSSLVIYNDSVFTQADFDGICKTGVGGKEGRTNTIGQFGLGALSMFHLTELGMIVSGDKVLFLNPSKTQLPLADWASLLLPLQQMQRLYPDHLATIDGLFGFELSKTTKYDGTIFRLPLRSDSHLNEASILQTTRDSEYVRDQIVRPYWRNAQQSLIFSKINSVATYYRTASRRIIRGWSLRAERGELMDEGEFSRQALKITGYASPDAKAGQDSWQIVYATVPISELPHEFLLLREPHRLRSLIITGLAARTNSHQLVSAYNLFSTLPLPMTTTLPVHLTASFILTPDRRHIRFDDYDNLESQYNRWLLSTVAPPLYLYLLEVLHKEVGHNRSWWPGNTIQQDNVTRVLVTAFYDKYLPDCSLKVCTSHFLPSVQMIPSQAIILGTEPEDVTEVLKELRLSCYVSFPPIIQQRCIQSMKVFNRSILKNELSRHAFRFISLYEWDKITIDHVHAVIQYLQQDPTEDILYLPIVPLANGSLASLHPADYKNKVYVWTPSSPDVMLFDPKDFVSPNFDASLLLDKGYNVTTLETQDIRKLISPKIPEQPTFTSTDPSQDAWITQFWKEYSTLKLDPSQARDFPLIPTIRPRHYVSINACVGINRELSVMIVPPDMPDIVRCLDIMGMSVVLRNDHRLPPAVTVLLQGDLTNTFKLDTFLKAVDATSVASKFGLLDEELRDKFAKWCRDQALTTSPYLISVAANLPIWPAGSPNKSARLLKATEIQMLPTNFPPDIGSSFTTKPCAEYSSGLSLLGASVSSANDLYDQLNMRAGRTLSAADSPPYKRLIAALLAESTFTCNPILLPNGHRTLVNSDTLYAREPLFIAAFGASSKSRFVHEEYIDMEARLLPVGLKVHSMLDLETFLLCATSIHEDISGADRAQRAQLVFQAYCEDLPLRVGIGEEMWKELDGMRFIPREPVRHRGLRLDEFSEYTRPLPPVVSPSEILLPQYEALAWTQRALFTTTPPDRILVAHPKLGKPSIPEVIKHLRVLVLEVGRDHMGDRHVLADLKTVYKWLDEHQDEIGNELITYHDERLFLNVDDPTVDVWIWNSADEMFLNIVDNGDIKAVRQFLQPFTDLLYVAGVEEIVYPKAPEPKLSSVEAQHALLKAGFNEMRLGGILTDVVFVSEDEERFPAHRAFLAPMSEYLKDLFCGDFTEAGPATAAEPMEVGVDYSGACVKTILDFIYTGTPPDFEGLGLPVLLDILDLTAYWGFIELQEVTQAKIIAGNFINPSTYGDIIQRATILDAKFLLEACEFYERNNRDAIERMKTGTRRPRKNIKYIPRKQKSALIDSQASGSRTRKPSAVSRVMHRMTSSFSTISRHRKKGVESLDR